MTGTDRKRSLRNQLWAKFNAVLPSAADGFYEELQIDKQGRLLTTAANAAFTSKIDEVSGTEIYFGKAAIGALTSEAKWLIKKMTVAGSVTSIAVASTDFDQIWDNRASLTYT